MRNILCFGELLLRLSPRLGGEWIREATMPVYLGGAELNVAAALARWHLPVAYCTALPDHALSREICGELNRQQINTARVVFSGNRIGTYYLPQGADLKSTSVIYDRAASSFSELQPGMVDWEGVLEDAAWFHFSAISPALNENAAAVCKEAVEAASRKKIIISVDLNYRQQLWQWGRRPSEVMPQLVQYCDVVMGNVWSAELMLGIEIQKPFTPVKEACLQQAACTSAAIIAQYPRCRQVGNTFRFNENNGVRYYATSFTEGQLFVSAERFANLVTDRAGSGDCFMAGLIYSNHHQLPGQAAVDFAAAAAFDKLFIRGDATTSSPEHIRQAYLNHG